jgi:hypothetical protein
MKAAEIWSEPRMKTAVFWVVARRIVYNPEDSHLQTLHRENLKSYRAKNVRNNSERAASVQCSSLTLPISKIVVEWLAHLLRIREVLGLDLGPKTG